LLPLRSRRRFFDDSPSAFAISGPILEPPWDMADDLPPELSAILLARDEQSREIAWEQFVRIHSRLLLYAARSLGRDYDGSMDRYTFVLERLRAEDFHRLRTYASDGRTRFTTWLLVVTRRLCLDHYRQRYGRTNSNPAEDKLSSRDRAARRRLADSIVESIDPALLDDRNHPGAQQELESSQVQTHLNAALGALGPRDRLLLKLRFEDDLPAREIGGIMGFATPFHVYRRLNRLLAGLRAALHKSGVDEFDT
jgi:RNA polymerase sigma factor (sigma-70 family)